MQRGRTIMIESELAYGEMPPLHVHGADESFHVFEGSLTVYLGEDAVRLDAGETFVAPRGLPHTYRAESADMAERIRAGRLFEGPAAG